MGQLSLYMDDHTLKLIESAAKREHQSISQWVKKHITSSLKDFWPGGYFEASFGSLSKEGIQRPSQGRFTDDAKRESI